MYELQEIADCLNRKLDSKTIQYTLYHSPYLINEYIKTHNYINLSYTKFWVFEYKGEQFHYNKYYDHIYDDNQCILAFVCDDAIYSPYMNINRKIKAYNHGDAQIQYAIVVHPTEANLVTEELELIKNHSKDCLPIDLLIAFYKKAKYTMLPIEYLSVNKNIAQFKI